MASISLHSLCEPLPRFSHCAVSVGEKIYFHGGYISDPGQGSVVDIFDPYFESWEQQPTTGTPPPGLYEGVCTSLVDSLYLFAGFDGKNLYNTLHKLDTATLEWRELTPQNPADGPMVKSGCGMVAFDCEHLAMFGGYGIPIGPIQRGATFTERFHRTAAGKGWSNELHLFNIMEGKWSSPPTTGPRPPPCAYFSFTAINDYQAVMFGGWQPGRSRLNDCYLIDFESMEWSKLEKFDERDPWPAERSDHAACCLNFGEENPQLLVTGGVGVGNNTFSDTWILDVHSGRWKELNILEDVQPRMLHTATAFSLCPGHTQVTKFGGCPMWEKRKSTEDQPKIATTTVLEFESVESLPSGHGNMPSTKEWVLVGVAKGNQLGSDNRVRVRKQQQEFSENVKIVRQQVAAAETRAHQAEIATAHMQERLQEAERQNQDFRIQIEELQQESQEEKRDLQQECDAAERDLQESQEHIEDLQETTMNLEQRVQDAESRVQELQREIEAVRLQKQTLEETLQRLQAQLTTLEEALQQSCARENQLDQRVQEAEHRAEDAERRAHKVRAQRADISTARMQERLQEAERQNQDFRIQIEKLQQESQEEKRALQQECEAAERDLQESQEHIENLQEMIMNSEQRVQDAESRVQELQREIEAIHLQKQTLEGTLQHLQAQQTTLEEALQQSRARENQLDQRVQEAEQRAEEAERRGREARQNASEVDPSWVVQSDEINLTDIELGRGGWAVVRVAAFRGIRCAAKCLYGLIASNYNRRLFNREMNMAARVRHPNLLQFIGATLEGELIILTELMPTTVRKELENERTFTQNQINSISLNVAQALNYLHLMRPSPIIHRDISSANVLLEPGPSNTWRAKVSDYGSVNLLEKLRTAAPGNPTYAAPEAQITALQSPKMDIFSFGVLLVEMCSAEFPEVADREELICSIPYPGMVALIRRCLAEDRHARPSTNDIIAELSKHSQ